MPPQSPQSKCLCLYPHSTQRIIFIPPGRSLDLVETLTRLARRWIYFTAAPPGQRGRGHINCRPHAEWLGWFAEHGWEIDTERTTRLREDLGSAPKAKWLQGNSVILRPS